MVLDRRKQALLQAIVQTYVERPEPVGSHYLAARQDLGVRSATIRNELAEMTELGYLRQPHTSAGRIPSDLGYRYFVDHLMQWEPLAPAEARTIRGAARISEGDVEELLTQTCRALSSLTRYTAVASPPSSEEPAIRQVHLVQVSPQQLLVVVVLESGQVVHRFCEVSRRLSPAEVSRLSNVLDARLRGAVSSRVTFGVLPAEEVAGYEEVLRPVVALIGRGLASEEEELFTEGASHMIEQPEFRDPGKIEPLLKFLEERKTAYETLRQLLSRHPITVSIGQENPHEVMREVSVVAARYSAGGRMYGWIGVLGPTRMHYAQAIAAVDYAARLLTRSFSRLGG